MIKFPPAKINLGLNVLFKREDGYHEIDSMMLQIPFYDILEIIPSEEFVFKQSGIIIESAIEDNLCVKAFRILQEKYQIPNVYIHLNKIIPMGAGLGGGSADAAFVIRMLNDIFELNLEVSEMQNIAGLIGSDCPFFILDEPQLAKGRGEQLSIIDFNLKGYYLKLINIGLHVSTKEAYSNVDLSANKKPVMEIINQPVEIWKSELRNDFENSVFKLYPELNQIKNEMYSEGAVYAAMSGSGSTMFGIFKELPQLKYTSNSKVLEKIMQL